MENVGFVVITFDSEGYGFPCLIAYSVVPSF